MIRAIVGSILLLFSAMFLFILVEEAEPEATSIMAAMLVGIPFVIVPAWIGVKLLRGRRPGAAQRATPKPQVPAPAPQRNLEIEMLRLARLKEGRLTVMEAVTELEISIEKAESMLRDFSRRGLAGSLISESGLVVYSFRELEALDEKESAQPLHMADRGPRS